MVASPPDMPSTRTVSLFLRITLPLAGMNFLTQCARAALAVVGPALAMEYGLSASQLGLLAAAMFAAYCLWQLPVGLLLDFYGPRRVQACMGLTAAAGFALFASADGMAGFVAARLVTGIGVAAGLTAMMKGNSQWFPRDRLAGITGLGLLIGGLGGMAATSPANALLPAIGWRGVFWVFAAIAVGVALWNALSLREPAGRTVPRGSLRAEAAMIGQILADRGFWRLTPSVALISVLNFTYQGLWAGPWLRDVGGLAPGERADTLFLYALGMMTGSALSGLAASRLTARGISAMAVAWACTGGLVVLQLMLILAPQGRGAMTLIWMGFACLAASGPTGYAAIARQFPVELMGRVATAVNAVMLATVFALQSLIGWILDLWPRTAAGGWDPRGYGWAIGVSLTLQLLAAAWALLPRRR